MRMRTIYPGSSFVVLALIFLCFACNSNNPGPEQMLNPPGKAIGILPVNGEPCSDYEFVPDDLSKVSVLFTWSVAQFAEQYELIILDGQTEVGRSSTTTLQAEVILNRAKTYTWSVTAKNSSGETPGDTSSFSTPGVPNGNYAPYTAQITMEFDTPAMELSISWVGSDQDNDELTYDVEITEDNVLLANFADLTTTSIDPIAVKAMATYVVKVISRDSSGNFSIAIKSEVFQP